MIKIYVICALTILHSASAVAFHPAVTGIVKGQCYFPQQSDYQIVRKLDDHHYEMVGNWMSPHAMLETKKIVLQNTGPPQFKLEYVGTKSLQLENGFSTQFDFWKVCDEKTGDKPDVKTGPKFTEAVGIHPFCKVFASGTGACDFDSLRKCKIEVGESTELCLPRSKATPKKTGD